MEKESYYLATSCDKIEDDVRLPFSMREPRFFGELLQTHQTIIRQGIRRRKTSLKKAVRFALPKQSQLKSRVSSLEQFNLPKAKVLGKMVQNKLQGYCEVIYNDGSTFRGEYSNGTKSSGVFKFFDGTSYVGNFSNESFHGEGKFMFQNGKIVQGIWNQGRLQGNARIIYTNGDVYNGETSDLKKHGKGTLYFINGTKFVGEFENGNIQGQGSLLEGERVIQTGFWEKGKLVKGQQNQ